MERCSEECDDGCPCCGPGDCSGHVRDYKWYYVGMLAALGGFMMVAWLVQWSADYAPYSELGARVSANTEVVVGDCVLSGEHVDCYTGFYNASYTFDGNVHVCRMQATWAYKRQQVADFLSSNLPLGREVALWSRTPGDDGTCVTSVDYHRPLFVGWVVVGSLVGFLLLVEVIARLFRCCAGRSADGNRNGTRHRSYLTNGMVAGAATRAQPSARAGRKTPPSAV